MSVFKVNPIDIIDSVVVGTVNQVSREKLVAQAFSSSVADIRALIENERAIITSLCSFGKDSTVTLLIVMEAYRQAIEVKPLSQDIHCSFRQLIQKQKRYLYKYLLTVPVRGCLNIPRVTKK